MTSCRWVPVQERSRSLALVYSGMYTGSILGLALSPHLIEVMHLSIWSVIVARLRQSLTGQVALEHRQLCAKDLEVVFVAYRIIAVQLACHLFCIHCGCCRT